MRDAASWFGAVRENRDRGGKKERMSRLPENLSSMVFRNMVKGDIGNFSLDDRMLRVLMALDGQQDLGTVARHLQMDPAVLVKSVKALYQRKLIAKVAGTVRTIAADFFEAMQLHLSRAVGPIAEILIEDELAALSANPSTLPVDRAAELVELLARQIPRQEKRIQFQKMMIDHIKSEGY